MSTAIGTTFKKAAPSFAPTFVVPLTKQDGSAGSNAATTSAGSSGTAAVQGAGYFLGDDGEAGRHQYPRRRKRPRDNYSIGKADDTSDRIAELETRLDALRAALQALAAGTTVLQRSPMPAHHIIVKRGAQLEALVALGRAFPNYEWERAFGRRQLIVEGPDAYAKVMAVLEPLGVIEEQQ